MILGNKCDLSDSRVVSKERGQLLADEHGIKFMETSAKASINVEEVLVIHFSDCITNAHWMVYRVKLVLFLAGFLSTGQRY